MDIYNFLIGDVSLTFLTFLAAYVCVIDFIYFLKVKEVFRWVKLSYAAASLYQFLVYGAMLLNQNFRLSTDSRDFARLGVVFLLTSVALGTTVRGLTAGIFVGFFDFLKKCVGKVKNLPIWRGIRR